MVVADQAVATKSSLGSRIHQARMRRKLSLAELAQRAGVSKSLISQIERDVASPSIDTLRQLASALGVPVFSFFLDEADRQMIVRRHQRRIVTYPGSTIRREILSPDLDGRMVLLWATFPPGESTPAHRVAHIGEELILVVRGMVRIAIGDDMVDLETGDSMTFDSQLPHGIINPTDQPAELVVAISPPSI